MNVIQWDLISEKYQYAMQNSRGQWIVTACQPSPLLDGWSIEPGTRVKVLHPHQWLFKHSLESRQNTAELQQMALSVGCGSVDEMLSSMLQSWREDLLHEWLHDSVGIYTSPEGGDA